ncbi:unnamed protein product [Clonostachys byssicola]|uniref:Major facilitator superfamily (MFS) profile domain-containing protein n=1 Tax=Clonostachys byssicola TaxID=160290 RepID=A0A9N9UQB5_9HYPO|nr:unnamed protein product [Clonostachys byssicola]
MLFFVDSPAWWALRKLFGKKSFPHPEETEDVVRRFGEFKPECPPSASRHCQLDSCTNCRDTAPSLPDPMSRVDVEQLGDTEATTDCNAAKHDEKKRGAQSCESLCIVDWYDDKDPSNPINWPFWKKTLLSVTINFTAFVVYMSSAIYTPAQPGIQNEFRVSPTISTLGLGVFILGYGTGPLFWSPLSEMPAIGRNIPYVLTMVVFLVFTVAAAQSNSFGMLLACRFLQGFFGSPILSTGGASLSDIVNQHTKPYSLYTWAVSSLAGPTTGTIIAGYTVPSLGWRWSMWEILITNSPALILLLLLPESSPSTILHCRAKMIRQATNKECFVTRAEIELANITVFDRFYASLVVPWRVNLLDPAIMFTSLYTGLVYAIFFSMFEFAPMVYGEVYGMEPGQIGLVLICNIIATLGAAVPYLGFIYCVVNPAIRAGKEISPERRLVPALFASILIPSGIFIFGWTSRASIHWIVPTIGATFATAGFAMIIQSIFVYISMVYPQYAASLFGGNGFVKAIVAFGGVLWSHPLYNTLGLPIGMSVLGAICTVFVSGIFILYVWGERLRKRSRFTSS